MKLLHQICLIFILVLTLFATVFILLQKGYLNNQLESVISLYLKHKKIDIEIFKLRFADNHLNIDRIIVHLNQDDYLEAKDLNADFIFSGLTNFAINSKVKIDNLALSHQQKLVLEGQFDVDYNSKLFEGTKSYKILGQNIKEDIKDNISSKDGSAICEYNLNSKQLVKCDLSFGKNSQINFNGEFGDKKIQGKIKVSNISLTFYKLLAKFLPPTQVVNYFNDNIKDGIITQGDVKIDLGEEFFANNILTSNQLTGRLKIKGLVLDYHKPLPFLITDTDLSIIGPLIKFNLINANIINTLIQDGVVTIKLQEQDKGIIEITAIGSGLVKDFIGFIPDEVLKELAAKDIDLKKITGKANTNIDIIIPLHPEIKNTYNITAKSSDAGLKIFDNKIILSNVIIDALFNGRQIALNAKGSINNFSSDINLVHSFEDNNGYTSLNINARINTTSQPFDFITLLSGNAVLNFQYDKKQNQEPLIKINSDLTNLEFLIDKVFIHKLSKQRANLEITNDPKAIHNAFNLNLTGQNHLKIKGKINVDHNNYNLNLSNIDCGRTQLKGKINYTKGKVLETNFTGSTLDLSSTNMLEFLKKEQENTPMHIFAKVDRVLLKDNLTLNNLNFRMKCNVNKCYEGHLDSTFDNKYLSMHLSVLTDHEVWEIVTNDAGRILKSVGMYNSMKGGDIHLTIIPNRKLVHKGEIVPIVEGEFIFNNFIISNTPFLTRLISIVSLPGLTSLLVNNKDISFSKMQGNFNYNGKTINIYKTMLQGPYMSLSMKGQIDTTRRIIGLKGQLTPSFYGINRLVKNIPLLGNFFPGKNRQGVIWVPYSIRDKY